MAKSFLRYPGGKTRRSVQQTILSYAPQNYIEYREPFVGGGGIFFSVKNNTDMFNRVQKTWINDINKDLISVYLAFRDDIDRFIEKCKSIKPAELGELESFPTKNSSGKKYNSRLMNVFYELLDNDSDAALRYFFINRTVWMGRVIFDPAKRSRMYFSNPSGWNIIKQEKRLRQISKYLAGTKITAGDYNDLLLESGEKVWIYCDPPYIKDTDLNSHSKLYEHSFSMDDHLRFFDIVRKCNHKVAISYDDDKDGIIRELYKDFNIYELKWIYSGNTKEIKEEGRELLITNYD